MGHVIRSQIPIDSGKGESLTGIKYNRFISDSPNCVKVPNSVIQISNLSKAYDIWASPGARLRHAITEILPGAKKANNASLAHKSFYALKSLDLTIEKGESIGVIGRNGSGKSTLLQLITGILRPSSGSVETKGRIAALLELGSGFNPEFTGRENVFFSAALLGFSKEQISTAYDTITDFANIGDFIDQPVKNYSSGMVLRLAFSVYTMVQPDILIVDEALAVGDEGFQRKCFRRLETLREAGTTLLIVSHSPSAIIHHCDRAIWLEQGELVSDASPKETMAAYHRFTHLAPTERKAFIQRGDFMSGKRSARTSANPEVKETPVATLDPELVPQSRDEYPQRGARIQNYQIRDSRGQPVNVLKRNDSYTFEYEATFDADCHGVFFAMFIKTINGFELGGATSPPITQRIDHITAGSVHKLSFSFKCLLNHGVYFINAGIEKLEAENSVFAHRIVDSVMFRVIPDLNVEATGIIDFQIQSKRAST
jgi:lipopolysaccharide transport system ATP-binding protein